MPEPAAVRCGEPMRGNRRRSLAVNIASNAVGRVWDIGSQLIFVPIYLRLLGPEAYGLVGLFTTLYVAMGFLDSAITPVLTREFGYLYAEKDPAAGQQLRKLLRLLERLSMGTGLFCGVSVAVMAPLIAQYWIRAGSLPQSELTGALRLIGLGLACQWPVGLYTGGYLGSSRQDVLTKIRVSVLALQRVGGALLLWWVAPRVELLFGWQALTSALLVFLLRRGLWRQLPAEERCTPPLGMRKVLELFRFGGGTLIIGLTASLLMQADNLFVSKFAPLEVFAAYSLSFSVTIPVSALAQTINSTLMPLFSRHLTLDDELGLAISYHRWSQNLAALCAPVAAVLIVFSKPLLTLWLGTRSSMPPLMAPLIPWIVAGSFINALMTVPYMLQLTVGWTRLSMAKNLFLAPVFLGALAYGIPRYGIIVGAESWLAINLAYYFIEVPVMHGRLLRGEVWAWWFKDTALPVVVTSVVFFLSCWIWPRDHSIVVGLMDASLTTLVSYGLLAAFLPHPRALAANLIERLQHGRLSRYDLIRALKAPEKSADVTTNFWSERDPS